MKLLLDTNVILNGIFVPYSLSYKLLHLNKNNLYFYLIQDTIEEAEDRIKQALKSTGINLQDSFRIGLKTLNINLLKYTINQGQALTMQNVKGANDRKLAFVSKKFNIPICTLDISDFKTPEADGYKVITPEEILYKYKEPSFSNTFTGFLATSDKGTIYMEFSPQWAGNKLSQLGNMKFFLFDGLNFMSCYFDCSKEALVVKIPENIYKIKILDKIPSCCQVAISYDNHEKLEIYFGYRGLRRKEKIRWTASNKIGILYIANNAEQQNQLCANIEYFCSLPYCLSETGINNLMIKKSLPLPFDRISLEDVIQLYYK